MGIVGNDIYLPGQYYTEGAADKLASIPGAALEENLRKKSKEETKGLHSFETRVACAQKPGHKCHSSGGKGFGDPSQENVQHGPWRSQVRCCRKTKADSENLASSFLPPSPAACNVVKQHQHRINAFFLQICGFLSPHNRAESASSSCVEKNRVGEISAVCHHHLFNHIDIYI